MRTRRARITKAILAVILPFLLVPIVKAPAVGESTGPASVGDGELLASGLSVANSRLSPKPLRSFVCLSSWYGEDFDGQVTANGEIYDMYAQTAAHPSLPMGSVVRIVNLRTQRSAIVRINDRGPYVPGRDLDVSYQVAKELGFAHRGTARVRVELLKVPKSKNEPPAN
ncbi:MAG: septal ring lytic transglycosylase RlpA family protein [Candidatus Acidiferrales bacterium]